MNADALTPRSASRPARSLALALATAASLVLTPAMATRAEDTPAAARADLVSVATQAGSFKTLTAALKAAGLTDALKDGGPLTVLAPTDAAFARLPEGTVESLLKPENREKLRTILQYHVLSGRVPANKVAGLDAAKTLAGPEVKISLANGQLRVNQARVVQTDIPARNGLIHVLDEVLLPPDAQAAPKAKAKSQGGADAAVGRVVRRAIERGVPLYNAGDPQACTAVYEVAALSLAERPDLPDAAKDRLRKAISQTRHQHGWSDRAWTLRRALDEVDAMAE